MDAIIAIFASNGLTGNSNPFLSIHRNVSGDAVWCVNTAVVRCVSIDINGFNGVDGAQIDHSGFDDRGASTVGRAGTGLMASDPGGITEGSSSKLAVGELFACIVVIRH